MIDPFTAWTRIMTAAFDMSRTGQRAAEMVSASRHVVKKRSGMVAAAVKSPLTGDYAELSRMLPEKVEAFSKAGSAVASEWWAMQAAFLAEAQHLGGLFARGRPPSISELSDLSSRGTALLVTSIERAAQLGALGLAPVHATATANARRLKRSGRTKTKTR